MPASSSFRRLALACAIALACSSREEAPDTTAVAAAPAPTGEAALADVSREQFAQLRWIEGTWRGTGDGQAPFYERYDVVDDTTILMQSFSDSTLRTTTDESRIVLTGGRVLQREEGSDRVSGAARIDATSIAFVPVNRGFTYSWRRGSTSDEWIASIGPTGGRTYTMRRWTSR